MRRCLPKTKLGPPQKASDERQLPDVQADDPADTCGAQAHRHEGQATHDDDDTGVTGVSRQPAVGAQDRSCLCLEVVGSQMGNPGRGSLLSPVWAWTQVTSA